MHVEQLFSTISQYPDNRCLKICFVGKEYPVLFCCFLRQALQDVLGKITTVDLTQVELSQVYSGLSMSFLGQKSAFWLGNVGELSPKNKSKLLSFLKLYQGPHTILFFDQQVPDVDSLVVQLPETLYYADFSCFVRPLFKQMKVPFFKKVFDHCQQLDLDTICLLAQYAPVISKPDAFITTWLPTLIEPDRSLFVLGTYFFAKNDKAFWQCWHALYKQYSDVFWTVFWSEQLYKAASFVVYARAKKMQEAKKISYNLPFTFIQKDWKSYGQKELAVAHDHLYTIDWNIKNGLQPNFELFFLKFFANEFCK